MDFFDIKFADISGRDDILCGVSGKLADRHAGRIDTTGAECFKIAGNTASGDEQVGNILRRDTTVRNAVGGLNRLSHAGMHAVGTVDVYIPYAQSDFVLKTSARKHVVRSQGVVSPDPAAVTDTHLRGKVTDPGIFKTGDLCSEKVEQIFRLFDTGAAHFCKSCGT